MAVRSTPEIPCSYFFLNLTRFTTTIQTPTSSSLFLLRLVGFYVFSLPKTLPARRTTDARNSCCCIPLFSFVHGRTILISLFNYFFHVYIYLFQVSFYFELDPYDMYPKQPSGQAVVTGVFPPPPAPGTCLRSCRA